ncbi:hypothetical protein EJB05_54801, partial [Eragrostis curvula]
MSMTTIPMVKCAGTASAAFGRRNHCKVKAVAARDTVSSGRKKDYYTMLSLEHAAAVGTDEIKRAYRRLALRYHPDVCPPSRRAESTELFLELRRAYETLADPGTRSRYDAELRRGEKATSAAAVGLARDVWEAQLSVLRARSERRQRARAGCGRRRGRRQVGLVQVATTPACDKNHHFDEKSTEDDCFCMS